MSFSGAYFGEGTGPVLLTYLSCESDDSSWFYCDYDYNQRPTYRNHNNDMGVRCQGMIVHVYILLMFVCICSLSTL